MENCLPATGALECDRHDVKSFEIVARKMYSALDRLARRLGVSPDDAGEVANDALLKGWMALESGRLVEVGRLDSYMRTVCRFAAYACGKARSFDRSELVLDSGDWALAGAASTDPASIVESRWAIDKLSELLGDGSRSSEAVLGRAAGVSHADIAAARKVPEGTVKTHVHRRRNALKKALY